MNPEQVRQIVKEELDKTFGKRLADALGRSLVQLKAYVVRNI